jgi:oligopeptide/dipeptide ABC transporter ATP-binding protein
MKVADVNSTSTTPACHSSVEELLRVRNLTVRYLIEGCAFTAVKDLTFRIGPGEIVGLLGESGCGKTTTALSVLRVLPEVAEVTTGAVVFRGRDLLPLDESQLRDVRGAQIAMIYQDSSVLNPVIQVGSQVCEVLRAHRRYRLSDAREKVLSLFTSIGLTECERIYEAYPHQLSGGQRQRIAVAQALICEPDLVIADEPTASVDPDTAKEILDCMRRMKQAAGTSFLTISHDPDALDGIADRIIVMYGGQIVEEGPLAEVYSRPLHPYTQALLQCSPKHREPRGSAQTPRLPFIPGNSPDPLEVFPGCSFAKRCQDRMQICDARVPELFEPSDRRSARCFKYAGEVDHA